MARQKSQRQRKERKEVKKVANLPVMNASASLYGTAERYAELSSVTGNPRAVIPQICFTVPVCIPVLNKKVRVCCGLFSGCSWSFVSC